MTKDRCVDNFYAIPTVRTLRTCTVCCSLSGNYSTYVPSAGEAARYRAKALVIDNTLLEGSLSNTTLLARLLIVLVFVVTKVHGYQSTLSRVLTAHDRVVHRSGVRLQYGSITWLYTRESGGTDF